MFPLVVQFLSRMKKKPTENVQQSDKKVTTSEV